MTQDENRKRARRASSVPEVLPRASSGPASSRSTAKEAERGSQKPQDHTEQNSAGAFSTARPERGPERGSERGAGSRSRRLISALFSGWMVLLIIGGVLGGSATLYAPRMWQWTTTQLDAAQAAMAELTRDTLSLFTASPESSTNPEAAVQTEATRSTNLPDRAASDFDASVTENFTAAPRAAEPGSSPSLIDPRIQSPKNPSGAPDPSRTGAPQADFSGGLSAPILAAYLESRQPLAPIWAAVQARLTSDQLTPLVGQRDAAVLTRDELMIAVHRWSQTEHVASVNPSVDPTDDPIGETSSELSSGSSQDQIGPIETGPQETSRKSIVTQVFRALVDVRPLTGPHQAFVAAVAEGDLAGALNLWPKLSDAHRAGLAGWAEQAQARLARRAAQHHILGDNEVAR